jgi:hypothetical protein
MSTPWPLQVPAAADLSDTLQVEKQAGQVPRTWPAFCFLMWARASTPVQRAQNVIVL